MEDKFILVSGANGGLGKSTVLELIKNGYKVIGVDINNPNINNSNFSYIKCDLTNKQNIAVLTKKVLQITDFLYGIVNLAGIFKMQTLLEGNEDDLRKIFEINFFATYSLNKALFPLLKKGSKIIVTSSEVAKYSPQPFTAYYTISKKMVDCYADILRRECNYLGIKVIKIQSGAIKTKLLDGVNDEYKEMVDNTVYFKEPLTKLKKMMDNEITKQRDPCVVANCVLKIIKSNKPKICYRIKTSMPLKLCNALPESTQDFLYKKIIK